MLAVKGVLGVWAGLVLMTTSPTDPRSFLGSEIQTRRTGLGVAVLILAVVTLLIAAAVIRWVPSAVPAALAIEAVGVVLALSRVTSNPGPAALSLALSAAIVGFLVTSRERYAAPARVPGRVSP